MKNTSILTIALCASGLLLQSCGGSSGDSSPAISDVTDSTSEPTPDVVSMPASDDTEPDGETDIVVSGDSILCASNTPTSSSVIGNNVFVFDAATGQCFGRREEANQVKNLLPLTTVLTVDRVATDESLITVPAELRLVTTTRESMLEALPTTSFHTYIVDLTNTQSSTICVAFVETSIDLS